MSIVESFGGMRVVYNKLSFAPKIPDQWTVYPFKLNFRGQIHTVNVDNSDTAFAITGGQPMEILVNGNELIVTPKN